MNALLGLGIVILVVWCVASVLLIYSTISNHIKYFKNANVIDMIFYAIILYPFSMIAIVVILLKELSFYLKIQKRKGDKYE